jgi:hypothetical protein
MKLCEFFGNISHDANKETKKDPNKMDKEEENRLSDEIFWFIIDDDDLYKKYFMPIARELKKTLDDEHDLHDYKVWKPMVNSGCIKYYEENDIPGNPKEIFNKKFRIDLCKRLAEHFHKDVVGDEYDLGK